MEYFIPIIQWYWYRCWHIPISESVLVNYGIGGTLMSSALIFWSYFLCLSLQNVAKARHEYAVGTIGCACNRLQFSGDRG